MEVRSATMRDHIDSESLMTAPICIDMAAKAAH